MNLFAGVDIGGTNTKIGIFSGHGEELHSHQFPTAEHPLYAGFVDALCRDIARAVECMGGSLSGVGVGVPNGESLLGEVVRPVNIWRGESSERFALAADMQSRLGVEVKLDNDAAVAAMGEWQCGAAKGVDNFVMLTLGTGVGGGVFVGGQLLRGAHGVAAELGHVVVRSGGRECGCGRRGCLERYVSASGIVLSLREALDAGRCGTEFCGRDLSDVTAQDVVEAAERGDRVAHQVWHSTLQLLASTLVDLNNIFDPSCFVIGGGVAAAGDALFVPLGEYYRQEARRASLPYPVSILAAQTSPMRGAVSLVL